MTAKEIAEMTLNMPIESHDNELVHVYFMRPSAAVQAEQTQAAVFEGMRTQEDENDAGRV